MNLKVKVWNFMIIYATKNNARSQRNIFLEYFKEYEEKSVCMNNEDLSLFYCYTQGLILQCGQLSSTCLSLL